MDYEKLLESLGIEEAAEFEYFENFADLCENGEPVDEEALYKLFEGADRSALLEMIDNYFNDIMEAVPDDSTDIYMLMETIKMALTGLLEAAEDETAMVHFCEELNDFRQWYCDGSKVECKSINDGSIQLLCLRDALSLCRIERLEGDKYRYDFTGALDYEIEEYIMSYADMARSQREDEDEEDMFEERYDDYEEL